jgi:integrase
MADIERIREPDKPLSEALRELIRDAHSENTRKAYRFDLRAYRAWGGSIPTTPRELADYISDEAARLHPSTITRRLAALSAAHRLSGGIGNPTQHPLVKAALKGLRRQRGGTQRQAAPLMLEDLWAILDKSGDKVRDQRDRALLLIGFAGGLRRSEIVSLNVDDLEFVREGLILTLRRSKTDQEGLGRRIGIPHARGRWCPVRDTRTWIEKAEIDDGPIFLSLRKGGEIVRSRLSAEAVSTIIKHHVTQIGHDPTKFSGHSLRAGFVTSAARAGIASHLIRRQTGHASEAVMTRYIREGELFCQNAAGRLM